MRLTVESSTTSGRRSLKLVETYFDLAYLKRKQRKGQLSGEEQQKYESLAGVLFGDIEGGRRAHRRFRVTLPAVLKTHSSERHGIMSDFSGSGMFLTTHAEANPGDTIEVKIGRPGYLEYLLTGRVVRSASTRGQRGYACRFSRAPMEMRYPWAGTSGH